MRFHTDQTEPASKSSTTYSKRATTSTPRLRGSNLNPETMTTLQKSLWLFRHIYDHAGRFILRAPGYVMRYGLGHAIRFTIARLWFTLTRRVIPVWFPGGYLISTPQHLINHQSIFWERELWHRDLSKMDIRTICDVGSNMGQASLFYRREFPEATIYMIDPIYEMRKGFPESVCAMVGEPLSFSREAIAAHDGSIPLNICRDVGGLTASTMDYAGGESMKVSCVPYVGTFSDSFDLYKIDTDGSEMTVLRALTDSQWQHAKAFVIECVPEKLDAITGLIRKHRPDMKRYRTGNIDFTWISSPTK